MHPLSTPRSLYQHRQTGWVMLLVVLILLSGLGVIGSLPPLVRQRLPVPLLPGLGVLTAFVLFGFSSLAVTVTRDDLIARFGIGLIRKTVALADIVDVTVVRTRWMQGWGIHGTGHGLVCNVSGQDAVRLRLASGRRVTIGSDEAARLAAAVRRAMGLRHMGR